MRTYKTTSTVDENGKIHLLGVPFETGTEVKVTISEKAPADAEAAAKREQARERMKELFAQICSRNSEPVGPLRLDEEPVIREGSR